MPVPTRRPFVGEWMLVRSNHDPNDWVNCLITDISIISGRAYAKLIAHYDSGVKGSWGRYFPFRYRLPLTANDVSYHLIEGILEYSSGDSTK